jgi:hypothetical protein
VIIVGLVLLHNNDGTTQIQWRRPVGAFAQNCSRRLHLRGVAIELLEGAAATAAMLDRSMRDQLHSRTDLSAAREFIPTFSCGR